MKFEDEPTTVEHIAAWALVVASLVLFWTLAYQLVEVLR